MALQFSTSVRNAMLDQIETTIGTSAVLQIFDGALPANCAAADGNTILAEIQLDVDWAAAASGGVLTLQTFPDSDLNANAGGTAAHFRLLDSAKTTCHIQGTVGTSGTDMIIDNATIVLNQQIDLTSWTLTAPGA